MQKKLGRSIGIDFGSCYCCAAVMENQTIRMIPNQVGNYLTPSYVAFTETQNLAGEIAKNQAHKNPKNTVYNFRKFLERNFDSKYTQKNLDHLSYQIEKNQDGKIMFRAKFPQYTQQFNMKHIAVMLLKNIKKSAQNFLGETCDGAVISIPAYYNFHQREQLKNAAKKAGFNSVRLCHQSSLVAIANAYYNLQKQEKYILIYDLGAQKCQVYLGVSDEGVVQAKSISISHIGGQDFTQRLLEYCVKQYHNQTSINIQNNQKAYERLKISVQKAKRTLTSVVKTVVQIEQFQQAKYVQIPIQRQTFQKLCQDLFKQTLKSIENVLMQSQLQKKNIHEVILVGGSSRIPKIDELICNYFDGKSSKKSLNRDQAISYGAAITAAILMPQAQPIEKLNRLLNVDLVPFAIGVKLNDENIKIILQKNTTFPAKKQLIFTTTKDNQSKALIEIFEIDQIYQNENILLGQVLIENIPLKPKGVPSIQISLQIDQQFCFKISVSLKIDNQKPIDKSYTLDQLMQTKPKNLSKQEKRKLGIKIKQQVKSEKQQQKQLTSSSKQAQNKKQQATKHEQNLNSDLKSIGISQQGLAILKKNQIHDCKILLLATQADLVQIGLPLGDRIKVRLLRK